MKKLIPVLAMIMLVPFVICSCFVQQAKSMKLSYEEIATALDTTVDNARHISSRARKKLQEKLEKGNSL